MDEDDPEKRIADLERQQAAPVQRRVTPEHVRNVAFSKPPLGKRGYSEDEVDAFLDLVDAARRDATGHTLTPEQVRNVAFSKPSLGQRGYNEDEVDAYLDLVEEEMRRRATGATQRSQQRASPPLPGPPTERTERRRFSVGRFVAALFFAVLSVWLIGVGVHNLWAQHSGITARVELVKCWRTVHPGVTHSNLSLLLRTYDCAGVLRPADGTEQTVTVHGVTKRPSPTIDQTVDVHLHGDQAYTNSLRLTLPDLLLGSLVLGVVLWAVLPKPPSEPSRPGSHARS